ncbi:protein phosphatase 1 regulatory subunit 15B isoform X1 [Fundulus heteroclitus]|uniref:protein phosphatase 1 regulatory subunit 15B isoform X1 n=1 Tax=Fundulus heteroclitus TaxID=8078 RepID=UPI00165B0E13|nr:protein phosphatase 1 regulatory subunit 15B isoform X1 [Fundulus heteroclitus]
MFRSFSSDARFSDGRSSAPSSPLGVASVGLDSQESSWLGLLSRPAVSLLRKVRLWSAAPAEAGLGFLGEERELLRQLHELMPPAASLLPSPRGQQDGPGVLEPGPRGAVPWLPAVSSGETELQPPQTGYVSSSFRALINQVLLGSQEVPAAEAKAWVSAGPAVRSGPGGQAGPWWGGFILGEDGAERLCVGPPGRTKPPAVFGSVLRENAGPPQRARGGQPHCVQNTEGLLGVQRGPGEAARPPPEQDNGYSSLEEELSQRALLSQLGGPEEQQEPQGPQMDGPGEGPEPEEVLPAPWCRNQDIAFIMGCPCSEDEEEDDEDDDSSSQSDSQSEDEDEDDDEDDDDDGFNSESSSDEDEDDEDEDEEAERLWTSLCQSLDPYNLRNFRAPLHTGRTAPASPPGGAPIPPGGASAPPPCGAPPPASPPSDSWDDSASEAEEAESLRLLSSLSCSSDPYSPFNFTAPLRTSGPAGPPGARTRTEPAPQNLRLKPAAPPEYRREEAEERLDSGFSEARRSKKVRFCDDVEEFFASGGEEEEEDRRGPWEELARDRCRFLRRCQEVEQSIGFCLQPQHRQQVFQRLAALSHT